MRGYHAHNILYVLADSCILLAVVREIIMLASIIMILVVLVLDRIPVCGQ